jgi:OMF family outer membrane factor
MIERLSLAAQQSRQTLDAALADKGVTQAQSLPSVSLSSSVNYNQLPGAGALGGLSGLTFFPANGLYAQNQLSGSWTIFDAFASHDAIRIADKTIAADELAIVTAEQDAMAAAAASYFDVLKAEALVKMNAGAVARAKDQLALGTARYKQDLITRGDYLQLKSQLGNALNVYAQATNAVAIARLSFSNNVNAPVGDRALVPNPPLPALAVNLERDLPNALAFRTEVVQARLSEEAARSRVDLQGKASLPTVALTSSYSQRNLDAGQFSAAMQMSWALFEGGKVRAQVRSATSQAEASHTALELARQRVAVDVRQAHQNWLNAQSQVVNAQETLASAQEAYRLGLKRYQLDLLTQFALSDVAATLTQAETNMVTAVNDQRVAQVRLARALGLDLAKLLAPSAGGAGAR